MYVNEKVIFSPPIKPPFPLSVEGMSLEMAPSCRSGCAHLIQFLVYFNTDEMMIMVNSSVFSLTTLESHKSASPWWEGISSHHNSQASNALPKSHTKWFWWVTRIFSKQKFWNKPRKKSRNAHKWFKYSRYSYCTHFLKATTTSGLSQKQQLSSMYHTIKLPWQLCREKSNNQEGHITFRTWTEHKRRQKFEQEWCPDGEI